MSTFVNFYVCEKVNGKLGGGNKKLSLLETPSTCLLKEKIFFLLSLSLSLAAAAAD